MEIHSAPRRWRTRWFGGGCVGFRNLPLPSGEVDASPRASGEGARIQHDANALTRAGGASSPEGRGRIPEGARIELNANALTRAGGASSPEGRGRIAEG